MDWTARLNPNGRWLVAFTRRFSGGVPIKLAVVPTTQLGAYLRGGWVIVAEDPDPTRYDKADEKKDTP